MQTGFPNITSALFQHYVAGFSQAAAIAGDGMLFFCVIISRFKREPFPLPF